MDLEHRGLRTAANIVFNRYLSRTGDVDDLSVFPLYLALPAGIRAHVSAMAAPTQKIAQDREKLQRDTQSYFHLGLHQLERSSPQLIAIGGLSGTGKSTVAREIAPHLGLAPGALVLGSDLIRKKLLGTEPLTRLTEAAYNSETDRVVYGELMKIAMKGLESGYSVVLDATFIDPIQRQKLKDIAQNAGIQLLGFWLEASAMTLRSRLQKRVDDPSDATNSVLERQLETDVGEIDWQRIDATQDCTAISAALLRAVNTGVSSPDGKEEKMSLMCVRVEPARDLEIADGPPYDTYEFTIPLDSDGHLDLTHWEEVAEYCTIKRFRRNASVLHGHLIKNDRGEWAISYEAGENDDEFIYRIASQVFRTGEVLSITQNDETDHLFRVTSVTRPLIFGT
jgi:predicted kinase